MSMDVHRTFTESVSDRAPLDCCRLRSAEAVVDSDDDPANPNVANGDPSEHLQRGGGRDIKVEPSDVVKSEQPDRPTALSDAMRGFDLQPPHGGRRRLSGGMR